MKKLFLLLLCALLLSASASCGTGPAPSPSPAGSPSPAPSLSPAGIAAPAQPAAVYLDASKSTAERTADLLSKMSLEDKAGQMLQGEQYPVSEEDMAALGLGSVLSGGGSVPGKVNTVENWNKAIDSFQEAALSRKLKIPFIYGADAVHGHNTVYGAVVFPHNIGVGAANDPALTQENGRLCGR